MDASVPSMDRRALLSGVGGSLVALSGCAGGDAGLGPAANGTEDAPIGDGDDPSASLGVELQTVPHVVTTYEPSRSRGIDPEHVVPESLPAGIHVSRGLFLLSWGVPGQTPEEHESYPFEVEIANE
jgi:hypothetical protein